MQQFSNAMVEIVVLHRQGRTDKQIAEHFRKLGLNPPSPRKIRQIAEGHANWLADQQRNVQARQLHSQETRIKREQIAETKEAKRQRMKQQRGKPIEERLRMARQPL